MGTLDQTLKLRATEIAHASTTAITMADAMTRALLERFGNDAVAMAEAWGKQASGSLGVVATASYNLSPIPGQLSLFDGMPAIISNRTPEGGHLIIPLAVASVGQVVQWAKEGLQYHGTQRMRFDRLNHRLLEAGATDLDQDRPWSEVRPLIEERTTRALSPPQEEEEA